MPGENKYKYQVEYVIHYSVTILGEGFAYICKSILFVLLVGTLAYTLNLSVCLCVQATLLDCNNSYSIVIISTVSVAAHKIYQNLTDRVYTEGVCACAVVHV